jgi:hypothetical protein
MGVQFPVRRPPPIRRFAGRAKGLGVRGRSRMTKGDLARAIARKQD